MKRTCSCSSNRNNRRGCLVSRLCRSSRGWIAFYKPRWIMESPAWTLGRACKLCNASVNIPIGEQPQRYSTRTCGAGQPESTRARRGGFAQRGVCGPGAARGIGCRPDASAHPPAIGTPGRAEVQGTASSSPSMFEWPRHQHAQEAACTSPDSVCGRGRLDSACGNVAAKGDPVESADPLGHEACR